ARLEIVGGEGKTQVLRQDGRIYPQQRVVEWVNSTGMSDGCNPSPPRRESVDEGRGEQKRPKHENRHPRLKPVS
ncbi:MAG: hypothetical protein K2H42_01990, partial [Alistipes sp.]|nr:hypothetical protein [Alistipes sp.]